MVSPHAVLRLVENPRGVLSPIGRRLKTVVRVMLALAIRDVAWLGTGIHVLLQRCLRQNDARPKAPSGLGCSASEVWLKSGPTSGLVPIP